MADRLPLPPAQLLRYSFGPDAQFEGQLVGALERLESGGTLRVLDALFVRRDAASGELDAIAGRGVGAGRMLAPLIEFRLDAAARRRETEKALAGDHGAALRELGSELRMGESALVVLIEHAWARGLEDAVARAGGTPVASEFVDATSLARED